MRLLFRLGLGSLLGRSVSMEMKVHETSIQAWTRISARRSAGMELEVHETSLQAWTRMSAWKVGKHGAGGACDFYSGLDQDLC